MSSSVLLNIEKWKTVKINAFNRDKLNARIQSNENDTYNVSLKNMIRMHERLFYYVLFSEKHSISSIKFESSTSSYFRMIRCKIQIN